MFVHLNGLDGITPPAGVEYFDIEVVFSTLWPPDQENNTWRVVMSRDDLDPDKARVIEAGNNRLTLKALKDE